MKTQADLYRELPSVDELLRDPAITALIEEDGQHAVADACRAVVARLRAEISVDCIEGSLPRGRPTPGVKSNS